MPLVSNPQDTRNAQQNPWLQELLNNLGDRRVSYVEQQQDQQQQGSGSQSPPLSIIDKILESTGGTGETAGAETGSAAGAESAGSGAGGGAAGSGAGSGAGGAAGSGAGSAAGSAAGSGSGSAAGSGSSSSAGGAGTAGAIVAAIVAQHILSNSTDREFEGQKTDDVFTWPPHFMTEPWLAYGSEKLDRPVTAGEKFDAAIANEDYGKAGQRLPSALNYWLNPGFQVGYENVQEQWGDGLAKMIFPMESAFSGIESWFD